MTEMADDSNNNNQLLETNNKLEEPYRTPSRNQHDKSSQRTSTSSEENWHASSLILIVIINFGNFVNGIYMAIPGPTLLFLATQVSCDVAQISAILAGRALGNLLGAFTATFISKRTVRYWDATMRLGVSFIIFGLSTLPIPFSRNLWLLITLLTIGGFLFGFTNTGFLAVQLDIWGEKKSRPLMQVYQAVFSAGATLAPLLAAPFLEMAAESDYEKLTIPSCLRKNSTIEILQGNATEPIASDRIISTGIDPVTWVYVIIAIFYFLVAFIMVAMSFLGIEDKVRRGSRVVSEARDEEPLCKIALLLFCVIMFYAFLAAATNVFASYIYSVSYCSGLAFSVSKAYILNCMYWAVFIVGRMIASIVAAKTRPSSLITCCVIGLLLSSSLLSIAGEHTEWVTWVSTAIWALSISPLFGSGVSWISRITNVSGRYAVIFEIGAALGAVAAFLLAGVLFDENPYTVIHLVTGIIGLLALSYVGMRVTGHIHIKQLEASLLPTKSNSEKS